MAKTSKFRGFEAFFTRYQKLYTILNSFVNIFMWKTSHAINVGISTRPYFANFVKGKVIHIFIWVLHKWISLEVNGSEIHLYMYKYVLTQQRQWHFHDSSASRSALLSLPEYRSRISGQHTCSEVRIG